jgi:hypothetical protein
VAGCRPDRLLATAAAPRPRLPGVMDTGRPVRRTEAVEKLRAEMHGAL